MLLPRYVYLRLPGCTWPASPTNTATADAVWSSTLSSPKQKIDTVKNYLTTSTYLPNFIELGRDAYRLQTKSNKTRDKTLHLGTEELRMGETTLQAYLM